MPLLLLDERESAGISVPLPERRLAEFESGLPK
jgi:hypothetical protein